MTHHPADYEECKVAFQRMAKSFRSQDRNEATTRLQLINDIFMSCLGWPKESCIAEESQDKEYADYTFLCPNRALIVEAKKEGDYFELPAGKTNRIYSIQSLCDDHPNLKDAIAQVVGYANKRGVPFAAVTNGHQVVALVAGRNDGISPLKGRALVFPSIQYMQEHFLDLWQALSLPAIREHRLYSTLIGDDAPPLPPKLGASIHNYPGLKARNILQTDLQILSEIVIEDTVTSPELEERFLAECYCQSGAISQYAMTSREILKTRYASLFAPNQQGPTTVPAKDKKGISKELLAESISKRPIMLVGDVGVGKSAFIKYLLKVAAAEEFKNAISLYVDLGFNANFTTSVSDAVIDLLSHQLSERNIKIADREFVKNVYYLDLVDFDKNSIWAELKGVNDGLFLEKRIQFINEKMVNKQEHLRRSLGYISKNQRKQIVIFLDNVDQRDYDTQQQAFLVSQEIAANWPATVYLTLRPDTYNRSLKRGVLSAYHPKAFTISPPRVDEVVIRRLRFARKMTSGEIQIPTLATDMRLQNLDIVIKSFVNTIEKHYEIPECLDNISGGNVRVALDYVRDFFGSGHVDTGKIIRMYNMTGGYIVPMHEFLRAVTYGDYAYYHPEYSPIANMFDVYSPDPREHFVTAFLISVVESLGGSGDDAGYVAIPALYERLQPMGFTPRQIEGAVFRSVNRRLLETPGHMLMSHADPMPASVRVTSVGLYHIKKLASRFEYHDAVLVDTPICDKRTAGMMHVTEALDQRLDRAMIFLRYLDSAFEPLSGHAHVYDWPTHSDAVKSHIESIRFRWS